MEEELPVTKRGCTRKISLRVALVLLALLLCPAQVIAQDEPQGEQPVAEETEPPTEATESTEPSEEGEPTPVEAAPVEAAEGETEPAAEPDSEPDPEAEAEPSAEADAEPEEKPAPPPEATADCGRELKTKKSPPVNFKITETLISEYVGTNGPDDLYGDDDEFWAFRNLLYIQANNRNFDSAMRIDSALFHNPPYLVGPDVFERGGDGYTMYWYGNDYRIERLYGTAKIKKMKLTVGDFYVNFGRGMALSLVKQDDSGVDNTLRGARVELRIPRLLKATLIGGVVNASNIDVLTHQVQRDDPLDKIAGARVEWEAADAVSLAIHGVLMQPRFTDEAEIDPDRIYVDQATGVSVINGGGSAEVRLGGFHTYLEGNVQQHDNYRPVGTEEDVLDETGVAAYGEMSYDLSPFNIKLEGIFYKKWMMDGPWRGSAPGVTAAAAPLPYHHLVTLEPKWMVMKSLGNAEGGRLTGDYYIKASHTQITLMTALIKYEGGLLPGGVWDDHPPTLIVHPLLKLHQIFGDTNIQGSLEGGYRFESTDEPDPAHPEYDSGTLWHVMGDVTVPIKGPHSIEVKAELRRHELWITESDEYWVNMTTLGYEWSGKFGLNLTHEYSDQTPGIVASIGGWELPLPRQHYLMANLNFHAPKPLDDLNFRLYAGSQRGGFKCVGGICRVYPDMVGVKLEAIYRF